MNDDVRMEVKPRLSAVFGTAYLVDDAQEMVAQLPLPAMHRPPGKPRITIMRRLHDKVIKFFSH